MPLAVESSLGPYRVQSLIGAGAMGEVYRARDTRLNRDVAIKIIQTTNAGADETRQSRFENEARAASALNHPNIVTIHDVGHEDGTSYIVTEFIEGESLRKLLARERLSMRKALDIAVQIADGLAAAHDVGIVHRDLKPENIMITREGRVKILDFGLAKEVGDEGLFDTDSTLGNNDTAPGLLIGTTAYMSPEQAKGGRISFFSDQFALGLILYEMLRGEQAFRRETPLQTLSAILTEDPPELDRGSVPLRWLVKRCLHKEPDHRYASTFDLLRELQNIRDRLTDPSGQFVLQEEKSSAEIVLKPRRVWPAIAVAGLAAGVLAGYILARKWPVVTSRWVNARYVPFSTQSTLEVMPAWSPNGKTVAYAAEIDGVFQIVSRSLAATAPVQLTYGVEDCLFPFWSADGVRVYYISARGGKPSLWSVGATGGTPELVVENAAQAAMAPDGRTLALIRAGQDAGSFSLWTGTLTDKDFRRVERGPFLQKTFLPWSYVRFAPDGKLGAWLSLREGGSEFWVIPVPDGEPEIALEKLSFSPRAREFSWTPDSKRIVFSDRSGMSIDSHLFQADLSKEIVEQISNGTGSELSPVVARDGKLLAFTSGRIDYDVVSITLEGAVSEIVRSPALEVSPAVSGGQLAYVTDRTGGPEIWLKVANQAWDRPVVTADSFGEDKTLFLFDTAFAPDGRRIAFSRAASGGEALWISTTTGDPPVRLAKEPGRESQRGAAWSPDGNEIAYSSMRKGRQVIMRARVGGFEPAAVIAEDAGTQPRWSPAGNWIATIGPSAGVTLLAPDGTTRKTAGTGLWLLHGWSGDGKSLFGVRRSEDRKLEVVALDVATGNQATVGEIGPYGTAYVYGNAVGAVPMSGFSISNDGRSFITSMLRADGDIWLIDRQP